MLRRASIAILGVTSLLAAACSDPGSTPGEGSSSDSTATTAAAESTSAEPTSSVSFTSSPTITAADESSTTGAGEPVEYVGQWDTGFGFSYFTACGETEAWLAEGLPGYEVCEASPLWLRVTGVRLPPFEGGTSPRISVVEILEGPCTEGSCDGSTPIGGTCGTFEDLCFGTSVAFECDPLLQDCPADEKCAPWANDGGMEWNATRCAPTAEMPGATGEPCSVEGNPYTGLDDCELGAQCWDVDPGTGQGQCVALCDYALAPDPVCPPDTVCTPLFAVEAPWTLGVCITG